MAGSQLWTGAGHQDVKQPGNLNDVAVSAASISTFLIMSEASFILPIIHLFFFFEGTCRNLLTWQFFFHGGSIIFKFAIKL